MAGDEADDDEGEEGDEEAVGYPGGAAAAEEGVDEAVAGADAD